MITVKADAAACWGHEARRAIDDRMARDKGREVKSNMKRFR